MQRYDVTALGEILIDFIPDGADDAGDLRFVRKAGGAPLNFLATIAHFGGSACFIGKVGNDIHGAFLKNTVQACGIDASCLLTDAEHNTTLAFVELDESGDREFSFYRTFGADRFLSEQDVPEDVIRSSKLFHFGSLSLTDEPSRTATIRAVQLAKESGCIITYDPNYRAPLWKSEDEACRRMAELLGYVDILKVSAEELPMLTGIETRAEAVRALFGKGIRVVLVTDGPKGAYACMDGAEVFIPPYDVKVIDTTGAGDIFFGTFISELIKSGLTLETLTLDSVTAFANAAAVAAGKSTQYHGAIAAIKEVD